MSELAVLRDKAECSNVAQRERRIPSLSDTTKRWSLTTAGCWWNILTGTARSWLNRDDERRQTTGTEIEPCPVGTR
jgi:hypothetical protein